MIQQTTRRSSRFGNGNCTYRKLTKARSCTVFCCCRSFYCFWFCAQAFFCLVDSTVAILIIEVFNYELNRNIKFT